LCVPWNVCLVQPVGRRGGTCYPGTWKWCWFELCILLECQFEYRSILYWNQRLCSYVWNKCWPLCCLWQSKAVTECKQNGKVWVGGCWNLLSWHL